MNLIWGGNFCVVGGIHKPEMIVIPSFFFPFPEFREHRVGVAHLLCISGHRWHFQERCSTGQGVPETAQAHRVQRQKWRFVSLSLFLSN